MDRLDALAFSPHLALWQPNLQFHHGFFVTGGRAVVNSAVDTLAGIVGLDAPDIIPVDPNTDIGYDSSRVFADIGTNAAFAALTASVSCASTLGQALNGLEAIGGAVNVGHAVQDMAEHGLTVSNIVQLGTGLMNMAMGTIFKNCFPAGTPVSTEHGQKPIEQIQAGDRVWAYSLATGQWTLRPVLETYEFVNDEFVQIRVAGEKLTSTAGHPFWVLRGQDLGGRPKPDHIAAASISRLSNP